MRILSIVDTREYIEEGDRWVPIPGSGQANQCARCGKTHEVHATVEDDTGKIAIVGTGCMGATSLEGAKRVKSATSATKRLASLRAQLARAESLAAEGATFEAAAAALPLPEIATKEDGRALRLMMGDAYVLSFGGDIEERRACLIRSWRSYRAMEFGWTYKHGMAAREAAALRESVQKLEAKLASAIG